MIRNKMIVIPMLLAGLAVAMGYDVSNATGTSELPRTGWTVGFRLYRARGFDSLPVRISSITSKRDQGLSKVELRNRSSKSVTAVRIGWYVATETGPGTILNKGETDLLKLPATLRADENADLDLRPVTLAKILGPLVKRQTLNGDFSVQVVVTEILYEDGPLWRFSDPENVARIEVKYAHAFVCGTGCLWNPTTERFVCVPAQEPIRCTITPDSCTVEVCDPGGN